MLTTFRFNNRSVFTLIELLVVVAIIALLAAILFPVFGRAQENARKSTCQSNQKQILLGLLQYTQDFDEKMPQPGDWPELIQPYANSTQIFVCPSDENEASSGLNSFHTGYIGSIDVMRWNWGAANQTDVPISSIVQPTTTVFISEGGVQTQAAKPYLKDYNTWPRQRAEWLVLPPGSAALNNPTSYASNASTDTTTTDTTTTCTTGAGNSVGCYAGPYPWHSTSLGVAPANGDTVNVGFLDGHVKAMRLAGWYYPNTPYLDPKCGTASPHLACP